MLAPWFTREVAEDWSEQKRNVNRMLEREKEILEMVQLVGEDAIPENERILMLSARLIRENFLRQNAYHPVDASCSLIKQYWMLRAFLEGYQITLEALGQIPLENILALSALGELARLNEQPDQSFPVSSHEVLEKLRHEIASVAEEIARQKEALEKEEESGSVTDQA
jgi:V/A-type H+-transporting ATPase subunit A